MRCVLHASLYKQNCFLTLTYDEKKEGYHNETHYPDIQKFKKDLRHEANTVEYSHIKTRKTKRRRVPGYLRRRIQIFNVHEYGRNGKKHWHLIVFNYTPPNQEIHSNRGGHTLYTSETLTRLWHYGFHTIGDVSEGSAMYQAQYTQKDLKNGNQTSRKKSKSNHSGIGKAYFNQNYSQLLRLGYVPFSGRKSPLPRYFEKLAHRHWCHFYSPNDLLHHPKRKRLYAPFTKEKPNLEIANLFAIYKETKQNKITELELQWEEYIRSEAFSKELADFTKSGANNLYDLRNRQQLENF